MSVLAALLMVLTLAAGAWFAFERLSPREVPARAFTDRELFDEARRVHVVIYSATWCPSCDAAKSFLWQNSVPFEEHDIDKEKDAHERWVALNPQKTIPVIDVEGDVVVGAGREPMIRALLRASRHHLSSARTAQ
jgi:glutaredoxin